MTLCELRPLLEPGSMKSAGLCQKSRWALCKYGDRWRQHATCLHHHLLLTRMGLHPIQTAFHAFDHFFQRESMSKHDAAGMIMLITIILILNRVSFSSQHRTPKAPVEKIRGPGIMRSLQIANISEHRLVLLL